MKELSIEEKAKRYDEAIEKAKYYYAEGKTLEYADDIVSDIFSELKETGDEKIRKELTDMLRDCANNIEHRFTASDCKRWLDWLEKKGEQKVPDVAVVRKELNEHLKPQSEQEFVDKVEPKFKVGDWVVNKAGDINQVVKVCDEGFTRDDDLYVNNSWTVNYHLWTIEDAKPGDVLVNDTILIIVDHLGTFENRPIIYSWYFADSQKFYGMGTSEPDRWGVKGFIPATKEQRETLFKAMQKAGYEWDAEKKELKKIGQNPDDEEMKELLRTEYEKGRADAIAEMQKSWSKEDESRMSNLCHFLEEYGNQYYGHLTLQGTISWLKFLKERVQPQPKQEWKQENTGDLTDFENAMMHIGNSFFGEYAGLDPNDTNAIKEQANLLLGIVPSKEWNEEDKNMLQSILDEYKSMPTEKRNWLKSLKERMKRE